jgi:hypothetical protein
MLSFITLKTLNADAISLTIQVLKDGLSAVHVPYSYGFAIILLTIIVKAATLPLTKKQVNVPNYLENCIPSLVPCYGFDGLIVVLLMYFRWNQLWQCRIYSRRLRQSSRDTQATRFVQPLDISIIDRSPYKLILSLPFSNSLVCVF